MTSSPRIGDAVVQHQLAVDRKTLAPPEGPTHASPTNIVAVSHAHYAAHGGGRGLSSTATVRVHAPSADPQQPRSGSGRRCGYNTRTERATPHVAHPRSTVSHQSHTRPCQARHTVTHQRLGLGHVQHAPQKPDHLCATPRRTNQSPQVDTDPYYYPSSQWHPVAAAARLQADDVPLRRARPCRS